MLEELKNNKINDNKSIIKCTLYNFFSLGEHGHNDSNRIQSDFSLNCEKHDIHFRVVGRSVHVSRRWLNEQRLIINSHCGSV